jgi:glycosyltransferase involved in cell wall biosynthesis
MQVLFVTPSYFPIVGGSEVLTQVLSSKLNEAGIHSDIMTLNMNKKWNPIWREETATDNSASVFREPAINPLPRLPNPLFSLLKTNVVPKPSFTKKFRDYDIVHFVGEADLSFPLFSFFYRMPKLFQCVGIFRKGGIYKYYTVERPYLRKIFSKVFIHLADKFIISSQEEQDLLVDLGVPEWKTIVLPIGVDTMLFRPNPALRIENMILFVGRIDRIKGLHILLEALRFLEHPVRLDVIGPAFDAEYMREVEKKSAAINNSGFHRVELLGSKNSADLVPWYQKAAVLVCPYAYETHSNVVRESLACGTPVVSTGSHILENCSDGISIARQNPKDLADAINSLLEKPEVCGRLGKQGRETIEQYFSWDAIITELTKLYEDTQSLYKNR